MNPPHPRSPFLTLRFGLRFGPVTESKGGLPQRNHTEVAGGGGDWANLPLHTQLAGKGLRFTSVPGGVSVILDLRDHLSVDVMVKALPFLSLVFLVLL